MRRSSRDFMLLLSHKGWTTKRRCARSAIVIYRTQKNGYSRVWLFLKRSLLSDWLFQIASAGNRNRFALKNRLCYRANLVQKEISATF